MTKLYCLALLLVAVAAGAQSPAPDTVVVQWDHVQLVSKTTLTLQVVVNPPLRRGSPIHDSIFAALRNLGCDYVRYVPWLPYPRLGVAELQPPTAGKTSWDFSLIDPMTIDFLDATKGHPVVLNFSTIPAWLYKTDKPVTYPDNPDSVYWDYTQGSVLRDTTYREIADYYARLYNWYTNGGFTDELGNGIRRAIIMPSPIGRCSTKWTSSTAIPCSLIPGSMTPSPPPSGKAPRKRSLWDWPY